MKTEPASVTRRTLLCAAPTLAVPAALLPASVSQASAVTIDPLPSLLALRERHRLEWLTASAAHGEGSSEEVTAWEAFSETERAIETTVATLLEGVAAQIAYIKESYSSGMEDPEARQTAHDVPFAFLDVIAEGVRRMGQ